MKIAWKAKTLYTKKAHWTLSCGCNKNTIIDMTIFYLLPTIEYFRDKTFDDDGDCHFGISFEWLFWYITINRYWGSVYNR